ncbi:MAG TPA: 5-oxoprolinase, partial [Planctomycetes bacterium]|nr:5-oxoprolinase [Planctomycetota bacterium]
MSRTFVDRGGTFTDVVVFHENGAVDVNKVPSDQAVVGRLARGALCFGTTVATNALLERNIARVLLLVTRGFQDLPFIGDMTRPSLFDPWATWPEPLCADVIEVTERLCSEGKVLTPLQIPSLELGDYDAVAICLLHAVRSPEHECQLAAAV